VKTKKSPDKCLTNACERSPAVRGLCRSCYIQLLKAIDAGQITDERAIALGLVLPKHQRPRSSPFSKRLAEALAQ
jgi:hypothetical protein